MLGKVEESYLFFGNCKTNLEIIYTPLILVSFISYINSFRLVNMNRVKECKLMARSYGAI